MNIDIALSDGELNDILENAGIVHLCGNDKPWEVPCGITSNPFAQVFFHYLRQSPYFIEEYAIKKRFNPLFALLKMIFRNPMFFVKRQFFVRQKFRRLVAKKM